MAKDTQLNRDRAGIPPKPVLSPLHLFKAESKTALYYDKYSNILHRYIKI